MNNAARLTVNGQVHVLADATGCDLVIITAAMIATHGTALAAASAWCRAFGYHLASA